jgi:hypothetical protein
LPGLAGVLLVGDMTAFPGAGPPPRTADDFSRVSDELRLFARIEGLCGEEEALLAIPADERSRDQANRLRAIAEELDRAWGRLRERAERLGRGDDTARA